MLPHVLERSRRVLAGAQHLIRLSEELCLRIADDLAEALVHFDEAAAAIRDRDAEVVFERFAIAVQAIDVASFVDLRQDPARRKPAAYCAPVAQYSVRARRGPQKKSLFSGD